MEGTFWDQLNATVTARTDLAPGLAIFRVEADGDLFSFIAGQYCVLGLPPDAPRVPEADPEEPPDPSKKPKMIRRAYSIASSSKVNEYLEFYIALVTSGELTPRIWALDAGDRIWLGPKATGLFTLAQVPATADLFLVSTGTGLAPYVSMIRGELEGTTRRVVIAHGARYSWDLGYRRELEQLAKLHASFTYVPSITRPSEDESWSGLTGYLQDQLAEDTLCRLSGVPLDPATAHVFLCGNPAMIESAVETLAAKGFSEWTRKTPEGQIHLEKYW